MRIISNDLNTIIKTLTKSLGVRTKKAILFLETTTNGLNILIKCDEQYFNTYDATCQIKQDGHAVIMLNDLLLLLPLSTSTNISCIQPNKANINGVDVDCPDIPFEQLPTVLGHRVKLDNKTYNTLLTACQSLRKEMKKSIFAESIFLQVQLAPNKMTIKHLSPISLKTKEVPSKQISNILTFYLSKNDLRALILFKQSDVVSFACREQLLISDNNITYVAQKPQINEKLFSPEYK